MKLLVVAFIVSALPAVASADVSIIDNEQKITVNCAKDKTVNIIGDEATVTLTGTCTQINISGNAAKITGSVTAVQISGNKSKLTLDALDSIMVSGDNNTVTWKKTVTDKQKQPKVMNSGDGNSIGRAK